MSTFVLRFLDGTLRQDELDRPELTGTLQRYLAANHKAGHPVQCLCTGTPLELSAVLSSSYFLRRYPGTDHLHHPECLFSVPPRESVRESHYRPGVVATEEEGFRLSLGEDVFPLRHEGRAKTAEVASTITTPNHGTNKASVSHGTVRLLGVLRLLMEEAGLNQWHARFAGKRNPTVVARRLWSVAQRCTFLRGRGLADEILWPTGGVGVDQAIAHFARSFVEGPAGAREGLVFGQLLQATPSSTGNSMRLRLAAYAPGFFCANEIWKRIQKARNISLLLNDDGSPRHSTLVLMVVRMIWVGEGANRRPLLTVQNIAPLMVNRQFIPADSGHEIACADYLVANGRSFYKPIRYSREDEMFPDFVLSDTDGPTHCEVWGFNSPEYLARKEEKRRLCRAKGIRLWEWEAVAGKPFDPLPPIAAPLHHPAQLGVAGARCRAGP